MVILSYLQILSLRCELGLILLGLLIFLWGMFAPEKLKVFGWLSLCSLALAGVYFISIASVDTGSTRTPDGLYFVSSFELYAKALIALTSAVCLLCALRVFAFPSNGKEEGEGMEYFVLTLFASVAMMGMVSAHNFLSLYVLLELQSLCLYILCAIERKNPRALESAVKYFVLGGLASGFLLFGISLLYGVVGSTSYEAVSLFLQQGHDSFIFLTSLMFIGGALSFKLSIVPFHMWTADVYEGSKMPVTAFLATASKVAAVVVFWRFLSTLSNYDIIPLFLIVLGLFSIALGSIAAIFQRSFKRLLAFSTVANAGYLLILIALHTSIAKTALLVYLTIYVVTLSSIFGLLCLMRKNNQFLENLSDFCGLYKTHPFYAAVLSTGLLSLAGLPIFAGFFGKLWVLSAVIQEGGTVWYILTAIIVVLAVIGAFYYVRMVKMIYMDSPVEGVEVLEGWTLKAVVCISWLFVLLFVFVYPVLIDYLRVHISGI